jgi:hypothetical protein
MPSRFKCLPMEPLGTALPTLSGQRSRRAVGMEASVERPLTKTPILGTAAHRTDHEILSDLRDKGYADRNRPWAAGGHR